MFYQMWFLPAPAALATERERAQRMGRAGREHAAEKFSKTDFGAQLE
jgi:hypothetical protein